MAPVGLEDGLENTNALVLWDLIASNSSSVGRQMQNYFQWMLEWVEWKPHVTVAKPL